MRERLTDAVRGHPRIVDLGRDGREQSRVVAFAQDLAHWLAGGDRETLGPLARVVTVVAARELREGRSLCRDRPLHAIEAAARAVEALWPLLRDPPVEVPVRPPEPPGDDGERPADAQVSGSSEGEATDGNPGEEGGEPSGGGAPREPGDVEIDGSSVDGDEDGEDGEGEDEDEGEPDEGEEGEPDEDGEGDEPGEGEPGEGEPGEGEPGEDDDGDAGSVLARLAEVGAADAADLAGLAARLRDRLDDRGADALAEAGELLGSAAAKAAEGAVSASRGLSHLERFLPGVGWAMAPGQVQRVALDRLDQFSALLDRLPELDRIAAALGRMEAESRREGRGHGGGEEVVGVRLGGDVAHALPSELGLLGDPLTEDLFYQRWAERRLVSLELAGAGLDGVSEGDKRGPVICCLDASASMDGPPELASKALVLALCRRVLPRGRTVHILMFGGRGQRLEARLRRGEGGLEALLDLLTRSFDGGTDFDGPLLRALELLEEQELQKADILVVTDGQAVTSTLVNHRVDQVRQRLGLQVHTVVLGGRWLEGVQPFSDTVWALAPEALGGAVALVRRITT